jgi:energy-coupling factor transporter ATP-binding protein EcfA2
MTTKSMHNSQTLLPGTGSLWHRWEPHIHAPGTIINDQFGSTDAWENYLQRIESAHLPIRAIGVTDYYCLDTYERFSEAKAAGRLPDCELIFPNIEMRLGIGSKRSFVNIHLLVSPEDSNHIIETKRFLERLRFNAYEDSFCCRRDDLIRLGRRVNQAIQDDAAALEIGADQFKVSFDELREIYTSTAWAESNILIAVAGGENDGTSGLRGADVTLREEIEKFSNVIFSSNPKSREYWRGRGVLSADAIRTRYGGLKPCLHGSDAHNQKSVGVPDYDRYSWIKGDVTFDALRQACIDPDRAYVGEQPPIGATPSQVIAEVRLNGAPWAKTPLLNLNPGLVAIIGPRGSGKTALADIIAAGCNATSERLNEKSFLIRAKDLLSGASVSLRWQAGSEPSSTALDDFEPLFGIEYPRARYLSQQFVEDLCSSAGMTDTLLREIERVVFDAHDVSSRDGAIGFDELLDIQAGRHRKLREREEESLAIVSDRIATEIEKDRQIEGIKAQVKEKTRIIGQYTTDRARLIDKGSEARLARLESITKAAEKVRGNVRFFTNREQALLAINDEVNDARKNRFPETLRHMQERHLASGMKDEDWAPFHLQYAGDVDAALAARIKQVRLSAAGWKGKPPETQVGLQTPLIDDAAELNRTPLAILEAEIARLQKLVGGDREIAAKFAAVSKRIDEESALLVRLTEKLDDCEQAKTRLIELRAARQSGYARVFEAVLAEQSVLSNLYSPLMERIGTASGALAKLRFTVKRVADVEQWARRGEDLLDLRRQGPFKGRGKLRARAERLLKASWETGDVQQVTDAMAKFREETTAEDITPVQKSDVEFRMWAKGFAQWLYSTEHIAINYSVDYDGVDIRNLSPGTRGIVLLLLYLALDDADDRPLIIDQPEENLDPQSIFEELVPLFVYAKEKRQVIIVTHNANLVVNTDADQIIVASAGHSIDRQLPPIHYLSGGLENGRIRQAVCDILEGGEAAFKERARRLRVCLKR